MFQFDHLVHVVHCSPAEEINQMKIHGFYVVQGGEHTNWGTHNSLCYFDLAYIEFLAVQNQEVASRAENPLIQQVVHKLQTGEGMLQIALRTEHMEEFAERLVEKGFQINGPLEGKRMRDDGTLLSWKMLFVEQEGEGPRFPFFIEWSESDEKRRDDLQKKGVISPHNNNIIGMNTVFYAVNNVNETSKRWEELLQIEMSTPKINKEWNAISQSFSLGKITIQFCEPVGNGIVQNQLKNYGELPFAVEFQGKEKNKSVYHIRNGMYIF
ncbi:VOC family protein [Bacillus cereus group sp. BfR-BA-01380]|uniref:VOC family protein n=1 Tax=Bacillus cereus group sp. BfR-BA-01380 TaxID=2920324 RepID=UPI001F568734|nr:VOC family protein [Bacillus cereus group sp. BfR-BA-01380]